MQTFTTARKYIDSNLFSYKSYNIIINFILYCQGLWMNRIHEALFVLATRIKFMCPMNFAKFPMDAHTCKFQVSPNYEKGKKYSAC